jgi:cell division protein FtsL
VAGKTNKSNSIFTFLFFLLIIIIIVVTVVLVLPAFSKYKKMEQEIDDLEKKLAEKNAECIQLNREVLGLKNSPKAVEKVAREKFHLCKPGETVYKYKK